jgi:hypothetical protein
MKTTVSQYDFIRAFDDMDRSDNFTIEGRKALFEWIEQMDEDCDHETTLDVIALCCEFTEYKDLTEFRSDYPQAARDEISDLTALIPINDKSFIIQNF